MRMMMTRTLEMKKREGNTDEDGGDYVNAVVPFVHVDVNHNIQEESMAANIIGSSSHLAFVYDPPLGPFSKYFF